MQTAAEVVNEGALERLRPVVMTVTAITAGLAPILWSTGTGADVMKRVAAPMVVGMITATILTLAVIPAVYLLWRSWQVSRVSKQSVGRELRSEMALTMTCRRSILDVLREGRWLGRG